MHNLKTTFAHPLNILIHGGSNHLLIIWNILLNSKIFNNNTLKNISNFALVLDETDGNT